MSLSELEFIETYVKSAPFTAFFFKGYIHFDFKTKTYKMQILVDYSPFTLILCENATSGDINLLLNNKSNFLEAVNKAFKDN